MKKIIIASIVLISSQAFSQVIIGDAVGTAAVKTSVLLEFAANQNKGLVVPYVRTKPTAPVGGTIILDATTPTSANVEYWNGTTWVNLGSTASSDLGDVTGALANQPTTSEDNSAKAIIGDSTSSADGVLVLESNTKAMVLPTVTNVNDIPSPAAGMLVYVKGTNNKRLAVFNGKTWSFWAP
ncbi:hypothetical protein [Chryseobacterium sp.]|uniref:hypothetical protein n=1 Tax=Chryseobacterium sp. TaxID=1871047 RepID=UPI00289F91D7|nr:hypothetical protein [Chryseobacterium sp.]